MTPTLNAEISSNEWSNCDIIDCNVNCAIFPLHNDRRGSYRQCGLDVPEKLHKLEGPWVMWRASPALIQIQRGQYLLHISY